MTNSQTGARPMAGLLDELRWRGLLHSVTEGLEARLASGRPMKAYNGFDPTFRSLHIGHLIPIFGLLRLQQHGIQPVALVGGGTGLVGDPRPSSERPLLTREQLGENAVALHGQLAHFLDFEPGPAQAIMANNLDWLDRFSFLDFLRDIGKHFPISYMLAKDSVQVRLEKGISFTEFSYMLLQATDFAHMYRTMGVEMQAGGADQWGNMTAGLELIRRTGGHGEGEEPAHALSYPLLLSPSGKKFGKSESGDSVWLDPELTSPYRFFQYWIDVDDRDIPVYLRWFTLFPREQIEALDAETAASPGARAAQRALARDVTERAHGREATERVIRVSEILFGGDPTGADEATLAALAAEIPAAAFPADGSIGVVDALLAAGAASSRGEARRLVEQGGVAVNGVAVRDASASFGAEALLAGRYLLLRKGKRDQRVLVRGLGEGGA